MKIEIKKLKFVNFKGFKNFEVEFSPDTTISGDNGTGKTSIVDGFLWLLFGKDSEGRTDFHIKHLNKGKTQRISEVEGILSLDGKETILKRSYKEKWVKRRGNAEEEFAGHESQYYIDDVPCQAGEYKTFIDDLCKEEVFRMITNPSYFPNLKKEVKRNMLLEMAGEIDESEIINSNGNFQNLFEDLENGETLEKYKAKVAAKKAVIKKAIEDIPARIDEVKRGMPESENWKELESELEQKTIKLKEYEKSLIDISSALNMRNKKRFEKLEIVQKIKNELFVRQNEVKQEVLKEYLNQKNEYDYRLNHIATIKRNNQRTKDRISELELELSRKKTIKDALLKDYYDIKDSQFKVDESKLQCPTCLRIFENSDEKIQELQENFNMEKSKLLEANMEKGIALKKHIENLEKEIECLEKDIQELPEPLPEPIAIEDSEINAAIQGDAKYLAIIKRIETVENEAGEAETADTSEIEEAIELLKNSIDEIKGKLALKTVINSSTERIKNLSSELKASNLELARLEGIEFTINNFNKAKMSIVESRVNSLFSIVKFRMFDTQINGGEVETCEEMVDGIPYNGALNNAMRVNAGLDIINAICKHIGIYAPIFFDNAESVNEFIPTESQVIKLVVTKNKSLIIK
ncbi:MAG TPA: AAA family ATPase [Bacteroidales bacterium]|nr:AAA family ATPase [Bacteroidales bacterium]